MKNYLYIFILGFITLLVISCNRDHLYYSYGENANVTIETDWSKTNLTPNGVSVYIFDHITGNKIGDVVVSGTPSTINTALSEGIYDMILINDTEFELNNISFNDINNIKLFGAFINANAESKYKGLSNKSENGYATDCDEIAFAMINKFTINKDEVEYYKDKPNINELAASKKVKATFIQITEIVNIEITVENINSAAGAPRTHLTNIAGGYNFFNKAKQSSFVTHEFVLNNRVIDPQDPTKGKITKRLVCFGPKIKSDRNRSRDNASLLSMNYILTNGKVHTVTLNVSDLIETTHNGIQYIHSLKSNIKLPESISDGDGAFNPDIEEWDDVEIGLPI